MKRHRDLALAVRIFARDLRFQRNCGQLVQIGQVVRVVRRGAPIEVGRDDLPGRVAQVGFDEMNARERGRELDRTQAGRGCRRRDNR